MLPLLHFLPIFRRSESAQGIRSLPPSPRESRLDGPDGNLLPAPMALPPTMYALRPASQMSY